MENKSSVISVIVATYNRSHILFYTLSSLLNSDFKDWECIIVGDACTDDTEKVVFSFNDPRLRFINLEENFGEQSGPNNHGCSLARGEYIAFLNHDDLWFPDHLSTCLNVIQKECADLVYTIGATIDQKEQILIECIAEGGAFSPHVSIPASTWLFKRELLSEIGPWHSFRETHDTPSQEWLWRVWKKKKKIIPVPKLTAVLIQAGFRKNCYKETTDTDHRGAFHSISNDPSYREKLLTSGLLTAAGENRSIRMGLGFKKFIRSVAKKILMGIGISPRKAANYIRYRRHGGFINYLRKRRGLKPK